MATKNSMGSRSDCAAGGGDAVADLNVANEDRQMKQRGVGVLRSLDVQPFASMRIHHVQLMRSPMATNKLAKGANNNNSKPQQQQQQRANYNATPAASSSLCARLHLLWKLNAWLIFAVSLLVCIARVSAAGASNNNEDAVSANGGGRAFPAHSDWYIVLVSIPVLDKVLPLKHLAEELLYRGYRVGFALPEVGSKACCNVYS